MTWTNISNMRKDMKEKKFISLVIYLHNDGAQLEHFLDLS